MGGLQTLRSKVIRTDSSRWQSAYGTRFQEWYTKYSAITRLNLFIGVECPSLIAPIWFDFASFLAPRQSAVLNNHQRYQYGRIPIAAYG
jgi:hypothetical protein